MSLRRSLRDALELTLKMHLAASREQRLSVIMFDIDHFKQFNDTFGHAAGDAVLARLGAHLRAWARDEDLVARYGGEEFAIVLPDSCADTALARAESLRQSIASLAIEIHGQPLAPVTISAGIATYPQDAADREILIDLADQALYSSKQNGRNRVTVVGRAATVPAAACAA